MSRILLIEDDQPLRRALRIALEKSGHLVVDAADGRKGLSAFKAQPAELVITDLIMPEMEGIETICALKKLNPALPIIAMTGGGRTVADDYLHIAQLCGATQVFAKPLEPDTLCAAVATLLANRPVPTPPSPTG